MTVIGAKAKLERNMAGGNTLTFTDENFESEVLNADVPVLVDFWAAWCGPCHMVGPVVEELANEYAGKVKVGKLDVDQAPATAGKFGIQSIPTVMVFNNGQEIERIIGARTKKDYKAVLESQLSAAGGES